MRRWQRFTLGFSKGSPLTPAAFPKIVRRGAISYEGKEGGRLCDARRGTQCFYTRKDGSWSIGSKNETVAKIYLSRGQKFIPFAMSPDVKPKPLSLLRHVSTSEETRWKTTTFDF